MTDVRDIYDEMDKDLVVKITDAVRLMQMAREALEPLKKRVESGSDDKAKIFMSSLAGSVQQAENQLVQTKTNMETVKERLELKKISYEAREIALKSWPRKTWIERLVWVATALFPSGGISFIFTGGVTEESLALATVVWTAAVISLIVSLWALKNEDKKKWDFFKKEFDITA